MRAARMPAAASAASAASRCARATVSSVTIAAARAGLERRDARAEHRQQPAADHDVIGARAERDLHGGRFRRAQRRGHHGAASAARLAPRRREARASAATISLTMVSCDDLARHHRDVGLGIDRIALGHQLADALRRVALQHRAVGGGAALDAPHQHLEIGLEPDRDALLARCAARVSAFMKAPPPVASTCWPCVEQAGDHARLAGAEIGLAIAGEDFRDGHAGRRLDLGVRIDERQAEPLRQPAADRGLARAHHADEHDRAPPERRQQVRPLAVRQPRHARHFAHRCSSSGRRPNRRHSP